MAPMTKDRALEILSRLGAQPATSYFERNVIDFVRQSLDIIGVPYTEDEFGNIVAHYAPDASLPPVAYVAHMDHPGFELQERTADGFNARALGGVPADSLTQGVRLRIFSDAGEAAGATQGRVGDQAERRVSIRVTGGETPTLPAYAVIDLPDYSLDGDFIRMRALDDLAGCASMLAILEAMASGQVQANVYGVFTRAEEVGLIGARLVARQGLLPREALVVSIESSRTLPGAVQGEGPVIRVGDASFTFDGSAEQLLIRARRSLQEQDSGFKVQRQLMSGGTCEATAFALQGYRTTGVAYPLGNYHNSVPEGGIDSENIHVDDFGMGVALLVESARLSAQPGESDLARRLAAVSQDDEQRLTETHSAWRSGS